MIWVTLAREPHGEPRMRTRADNVESLVRQMMSYALQTNTRHVRAFDENEYCIATLDFSVIDECFSFITALDLKLQQTSNDTTIS